MAISTVFRWILHGKLNENQTKSIALVSQVAQPTPSADEMFRSLFNMNAIHPLDQAGDEKIDPALLHFSQTMTQLPKGQYQLRLPRKDNFPDLPTNRNIATKQSLDIMRKWKKKDKVVLQKYYDTIEGYIRDGQIEEVPVDEIGEEKYVHYLTHHAMIKPEKHAAIWPVFNGSLGKPSLNDYLHTGTNDVSLMTSLLIRLHRIVLTGDYRKAFLHVKIDPRDRNLQQYLW